MSLDSMEYRPGVRVYGGNKWEHGDTKGALFCDVVLVDDGRMSAWFGFDEATHFTAWYRYEISSSRAINVEKLVTYGEGADTEVIEPHRIVWSDGKILTKWLDQPDPTEPRLTEDFTVEATRIDAGTGWRVPSALGASANSYLRHREGSTRPKRRVESLREEKACRSLLEEKVVADFFRQPITFTTDPDDPEGDTARAHQIAKARRNQGGQWRDQISAPNKAFKDLERLRASGIMVGWDVVFQPSGSPKEVWSYLS